MNSSKLGLSLTSSVVALALCVAPVNSALAAQPEDAAEGAEDGAPEGEDGEGEGDAEGDDAEGEDGEGEPADGEGEDGEGEPADGEGEDGEGEPADADGEGEDGEGEPADADGEGEDAEDEDGEGEEAEEDLAPPEPEDQRPPEPTWGAKKPKPMNGKGMLITGGIVTALGAGFLATSIVLTTCDFDSALSCKYGDQRDLLVPTAVASTALGLLLIGVGLGNRARYKKWENWTPENKAAFVPTPTFMPGGGGVALVGRF